MKKRLQCLLLAVLMLSACLLTSCGGGEEDPNAMSFNGKSNSNPAMTITIWGIKGENTTDEAVALVEDAMSKVTQAEYNTAIKLNLFTYDEYPAALEAQLAEASRQSKEEERILQEKEEIDKLLGRKSSDTEEAATLIEDETIINEIGISEVVYPEAEEGQLDIFYIPDYEYFEKYKEDDHLSILDTELNSTGKLMKQYIHPEILEAGKIDGVTYAVINNKPIGQYTYLLVNNKLLEKYYLDAADINSFARAEKFIVDVGTYESNIVPVLGDFEPVGMQYFTLNGERSVVGNIQANELGENAHAVPRNLFTLTTYTDHLKLMKKLKSLGYVGNGTADVGEFAVGVIKGTVADVEKYTSATYVSAETSQEKPLYTAHVLQTPRITNDIYNDMFSISSYTKDMTRSMEILCAINTNSELRNIFAYGIEGVHYTLDADGVVRKLNTDENNIYDTDIKYTGNQFITHPYEGAKPTVWEDCKAQNREIAPDAYFGFYFEELVDPALMAEVAKISKGYFDELEAISYDQFDTWLAEVKEELKNNETITKYTSYEDPESLTAKYNDWFTRLYPNALKA